MRAPLARRAKQIADEALYRASSAGSSIIAGGGFQNTVYVTPSGNDVTGDGSFFRPFATIGRANTFLLANATPSSPYLCTIGIGVYTENVALVPFVTYVAADQDDFNVQIDGNVTLDPSFATFVGDFPISSLESLIVLGTTTLDFAGIGSTDGSFFTFNTNFNDTFIANGTNPDNGVIFVAASLQDTGETTLTGCFGQSFLTNFGNLTLVSTATAASEFTSLGDQIGIPFGATVTLTIDASAAGALSNAFAGIVSGVTADVVLNGTNALYTCSTSSIGQSVTLTGGAPDPIITGSGSAPAGAILIADGSGNWVFGNAFGLKYVPAVAGNWAGTAPTTVQQALDRIAANTTNAHPIP
jgi:hypothetical protein